MLVILVVIIKKFNGRYMNNISEQIVGKMLNNIEKKYNLDNRYYMIYEYVIYEKYCYVFHDISEYSYHLNYDVLIYE